MALKIDRLNIGYNNEVILRNVNIYIHDKGSIAIIGSNGSGKSTFLKSIIGVSDLFNGEIILNDKKISYLKPWEKTISGIVYVPQSGGLFPDMTVGEHINLMPNNKAAEKDIFNKFSWIYHVRNTKVSFLSGGQQRFLLIILALFSKPKLILFDEPSAGLDSDLQSNLKDLMLSIRGKCILMIAEQNLSFVSDLVDEIYCIEDGKMLLMK